MTERPAWRILTRRANNGKGSRDSTSNDLAKTNGGSLRYGSPFVNRKNQDHVDDPAKSGAYEPSRHSLSTSLYDVMKLSEGSYRAFVHAWIHTSMMMRPNKEREKVGGRGEPTKSTKKTGSLEHGKPRIIGTIRDQQHLSVIPYLQPCELVSKQVPAVHHVALEIKKQGKYFASENGRALATAPHSLEDEEG
ncbi:hypothetical protein EI94DRAFT_1696334 [Lactarius quietus]|nr:hypothetical protein EI94DRAFT_1696334 [Lactarius quietus]